LEKTFSKMRSASPPLMRITDMAPMPGAVERAQMVSVECIAFIAAKLQCTTLWPYDGFFTFGL
jgi:hypothetical protein